MEKSYPHLPLQREEPVTGKRSVRRFIFKSPDYPLARSKTLKYGLQSAIGQRTHRLQSPDDGLFVCFIVAKDRIARFFDNLLVSSALERKHRAILFALAPLFSLFYKVV